MAYVYKRGMKSGDKAKKESMSGSYKVKKGMDGLCKRIKKKAMK